MTQSTSFQPELIEAMGYPAEIHKVTTEDGYILELHRIPHGINKVNKEKRPPIYLNHCLLCSSADYVMNSPDKALGNLLSIFLKNQICHSFIREIRSKLIDLYNCHNMKASVPK